MISKTLKIALLATTVALTAGAGVTSSASAHGFGGGGGHWGGGHSGGGHWGGSRWGWNGGHPWGWGGYRYGWRGYHYGWGGYHYYPTYPVYYRPACPYGYVRNIYSVCVIPTY